jgi:hypothetical protein
LGRFRRTVTLVGPGLASAEAKSIEVPANQETEVADLGFVLAKDIAPGRHVFRLRIDTGTDLDPSDAFVIVDVEKPE